MFDWPARMKTLSGFGASAHRADDVATVAASVSSTGNILILFITMRLRAIGWLRKCELGLSAGRLGGLSPQFP